MRCLRGFIRLLPGLFALFIGLTRSLDAAAVAQTAAALPARTSAHPSSPIPPLPSFRNDVMAVLSKAGCNAGTCHGNKIGKAGFKLSLRGENPEADFLALTRDAFGRRSNP